MSRVKDWIMDLEDQAWSTVESKIGDCEHEAAAMTMAVKVFGDADLLHYVEVNTVEEGALEMFQEQVYSGA